MNARDHAVLSAEAVEEVASRLANGEVVRKKLDDGGRIHIDRLQPFLCVYRQPSDRLDNGTERLLLGQASYILTGSDIACDPSLRALISTLSEVIVDAYGAVLVLELWTAPDPSIPVSSDVSGQDRFRIIAADHGVPNVTIETLEHALLATTDDHACEIKVEYRSGAAPPGMPPLLSTKEEERDNEFLIGLEVPPNFRDAETGTVFPVELRQLTARLGRALRQSFYTFTHARATFRPVHYEELGRRAMTRAVSDADKGLGEVGDAFDLLLHVTPVNADAAFQAFVASNYERLPEFLYRPQTIDPGDLKYRLYKVPVERIEDPALYHLFAAQRDELDRMITMLTDRCTPLFLLESQQVFGQPDENLILEARRILEILVPNLESDEKAFFDAQEFARAAETELAYYRQAWPELPARIEVRDDVPGIMVSQGHFLIGDSVKISKARTEPILHHEIGTHILTFYNGLQQPLSQFHAGMPGYEETQEGLAVLSEYLSGGLTPQRLLLLAARVVAVESVIQGANFIETFRILVDEYGFERRSAFSISMRVHRGGGFTKDLVYLRGLISVLNYLAEGRSFDDLLLGKVAFEHMQAVEELRWRQVVTPGPLRPRYLEDKRAVERLETLTGKGKPGVLSLINVEAQ